MRTPIVWQQTTESRIILVKDERIFCDQNNFWLYPANKRRAEDFHENAFVFAIHTENNDTRCNSRDQSPLCVPPFSPSSPRPSVTHTRLLSGEKTEREREKRKEFLPRFSRRVDLGHTLLFTCCRLGIRTLSRLSNPCSHPPSLCLCPDFSEVLRSAAAGGIRRIRFLSSLLLRTRVRCLFVARLKGAFRPVRRGRAIRNSDRMILFYYSCALAGQNFLSVSSLETRYIYVD